METEIIVALGIFLGCFLRALLPWLKKKSEAAKAGEQVKWESRFVWTLVFNLVVALIATILILPSFPISGEYVFVFAFTFGWSSQDIVNKLVT